MITHYQTLEVPPAASSLELRVSYLALAARLHPDTGKQPNGGLFAAVTEAYAVLRDPVRRKQYDAQLALLSKPCAKCKGEGKIYRMRGFHERVATPCTECGGTGQKQ